MKIEKISECKGASRFGTCSECCGGSDTHELYRIKFNGVSICLCRECFERVKNVIDRFWEESEE